MVEGNLLLTDVFNLLKPFIESYAENVISETGVKFIQNNREQHVIKKEKEKTLQELHKLIDINEDNKLITSGEFYTFFKYDANRLINQLLEISAHTIQEESFERQIESLLVLYNSKFDKASPYEKSLGANFIKKFFEICFNFKKNVLLNLIAKDTSHAIEFEINTNMLLKITENIENILENFQKVYDHIEMKSKPLFLGIEDDNSTLGDRKTVKNFAELFQKPLIFEELHEPKTLEDVFVWPDYRNDLLNNAQDDLTQTIYEFLNSNLKIYLYDKGISKLRLDKDYNILVILGMGGMGKSSLLEKVAYDIWYDKIKVNGKNIFCLKFSTMEYKSDNLLENIISFLNISKDIVRNSILILDAFDEYVLNVEKKQRMIEIFCHDIQLLNCRVIITSRENYIDTKNLQNSFVIELLTFNVDKRKKWLKKYNNELPLQIVDDICTYKDENDIYGNEFIGIPIIIYMVASNSIRISDYKSKFEFYNDLFGKNGLWYKRMYDINHPALLTRNDILYNFILKISEIMYHKSKISVKTGEIETVIEEMVSPQDISHIKNWYGIVTYFRKNKLREIEFAHKSIYEYYAANKIYIQLEKIINEKDKTQKCVMLHEIFNKGIVTKEIINFIEGFIEQDIEKYTEIDLKDTFNLIIDTQKIFEESRFNDLEEVYNYFCNAINCLLRIIEKKRDNNYIHILDEKNYKEFSFFLKNNCFHYLNLRKLNLSNKKFSRLYFKNVNLLEADMRNSDFSYCDFTDANLQKCNFSNSNLFSAIFSNTNLCDADLRGCNLNNMIIKKTPKFYRNTKININQIKYFWPEITMIYKNFQIYIKNFRLATEKEIEFEFDKIRGFHLEI